MNDKYIKLNNGILKDSISLGTYQISNDKIYQVIIDALDCGYRSIDTASYYNNEMGIGKAIRDSNISRDNIFITSKLWNDNHGYEETLKAFNKSLKDLQTDYLDMYLIHWPNKKNKETWRAFEKLYKEGYVKAIGVSNFDIDYLKDLIINSEIAPSVNQIEFHPYLIQPNLNKYCKENSIIIEAWSPFMRGKVFDIELLKNLSIKHNKTISQIIIRWDLQMGVATIPKTSSIERMLENLDVFDFVLTEQDMKDICNLNKNKRVGTEPSLVYNNPNIIN